MGQSYLSFTVFMCAMVTFCGAHILVRCCRRWTAALLQLAAYPPCDLSGCCGSRACRFALLGCLRAYESSYAAAAGSSSIKTAEHLPQADAYVPTHRLRVLVTSPALNSSVPVCLCGRVVCVRMGVRARTRACGCVSTALALAELLQRLPHLRPHRRH